MVSLRSPVARSLQGGQGSPGFLGLNTRIGASLYFQGCVVLLEKIERTTSRVIFLTMFRRLFLIAHVPLGRWTRTDSSANAIKIDWANTDHCGTCTFPQPPDLKNTDEEKRSMHRRSTVPVHRPRPVLAVPAVRQESPLAASIKQGFGWGLGNAMATTLMNAGFPKVPVAASGGVATVVPASSVPVEYTQCMKDIEDKEACKHLLK